MAEEQNNINQNFNFAQTGLNMDLTPSKIKEGMLTYCLNGAVESFDASGINYQNEQGNEFCLSFPEGFVQIGTHFINEKNKHIFFITNPNSDISDKDEIGYMENNDCVYRTLIKGDFGFDIHYPIHKCVHKIGNCSTEIYWTDGLNPRRYLNIEKIPRVLVGGTPACNPIYGDEVDVNQLKLQPDFSIPQLSISDVTNIGSLVAGTYQFAIQYCDISGNAYTSYYSITNPTPITDTSIVTPNFNSQIGKSIVLDITNLDLTGQFRYFNLAVIKTINAISSVELVGTYFIDGDSKQIIYTGQVSSNTSTNTRLSINDIFEKFPYYDVAQDLTNVQDVLVWDGLLSIDRINYQQIANKIKLQWQTWRIPANESYADEINATNFRSYLRDEVYPFEIVFLLKNGKQTDGFHIPGRKINYNETTHSPISETDPDFVGTPDYYSGEVGYSPYWRIYNTARVTETSSEYTTDPNYKGPYQSGEFAYWESSEEYPCNENVWGELAGQKIRHHKFPDVLVSPIFEAKDFVDENGLVMDNEAIFPIGVKIEVGHVKTLINQSSLTSAEKDDIVGFKIVRGDRSTNKSVIAKGILRNVGKYERENKEFYFPNYPYNDLNQDEFINGRNNAYAEECISYDINVQALYSDPLLGKSYAKVEYIDCNTNLTTTTDPFDLNNPRYIEVGLYRICSIGRPVFKFGSGTVGTSSYEIWRANSGAWWSQGYRLGYYDRYLGYTTDWIYGNFMGGEEKEYQVVPNSGGIMLVEGPGDLHAWYVSTVTYEDDCDVEIGLPAIKDAPELAYRQIFNSPETSFSKPFLGNILKLENVMFGAGVGHFVEVKNNAKYKLLSEQAQHDALLASEILSASADPFDLQIMFSAYQAYQQTYINGITRKNFAYSYNSIASYDYSESIPNGEGIKQRNLDIKKYLVPSVVSTTDDLSLNNWNRETSVYLRTVGSDGSVDPLPFPDKSPNMLIGGNSKVTDVSRKTISKSGSCNYPAKETDIKVVSYYASIKNYSINQWGQIYSYNTIDTGYQNTFDNVQYNTIFGGDTFINRFAFKTKLPFFLDNRVGAPDDSDIFYDEIGNIGFPKYWHSARSILKDFTLEASRFEDSENWNGPFSPLTNIISYKAHNFDCPNSQGSINSEADKALPGRTYYDGFYYLFAYGVPNFYCESSVNVDLRQAFNNKEGDFFPHVTNHIPDDWVQENFVPIAQDNTYYYNTTFSKQNKENVFTHLPPDWEDKLCFTHYPFRAIYSDSQNTDADARVNAWLNYRALSYFDFPQNYGKLVSLDGIQNKAVLARFENKTLLYDNLLTIDTSNPQAAYVGNPYMFKKSPPIDFAETDLGYIGSQNKMLLKIPQGQLTVDAKRGQVFLLNGAANAVDLSGFGSGLNRFFTDHLAFEILRYFPQVDTDNHFNGIGLHGVYDSKFDRLLLTKLDYIPIDSAVKYDPDTKEFYIENVTSMVICHCDLFGFAYALDPCPLEGTAQECKPAWILDLVNYAQFSGNESAFDIITPSLDVYVFGFSIDSSSTNLTIFDSLAAYLNGDPTPIYDFDTTDFNVIYFNEMIYIIQKVDGLTIDTEEYFTPEAMTVSDGWYCGEDTVSPELLLAPATTTTTTTVSCSEYEFVQRVVVSLNDPNYFCNKSWTLSYNMNTKSWISFHSYVPNWYIAENNFFYSGINGCCEDIDFVAAIMVTTTSTTTIYSTTTTTTTLVITTTTTTTLINVSSCGVLLVTSIPSGDIYDYEPSLGTCRFLASTGIIASDIANTATKLWLPEIDVKEFDITLSPFSISFNRSLTFPSYPGAGLTVKSADDITGVYELIGGGAPNSIKKFTITSTGVTESVIFNMGADRWVTGDIIYNSVTDTYLISNHTTSGSDYYITEYTSTGTVIFEISIFPTDIYGLFVYNGINYAVGRNRSVYKISPLGIIFDSTIPTIPSINGSSQNITCTNITTSTTSTTSTTTTMYVCHRPTGLKNYPFVKGYTLTTPPVTFVSTGSSEEACAAENFISLYDTTTDPNGLIVSILYCQAASLAIGNTVYNGWVTTDCNVIPDGWYFTQEMMYTNSILYILGGKINQITSCIPTTTTTTTAPTTTTTTTILITYSCGDIISYDSEDRYETEYLISLGSLTGYVLFDFNPGHSPDRFVIIWDGTVVIDTGYYGDAAYDLGGVNRSSFNFGLLGKIDPITSNAYPDVVTYPDDGYPRVDSILPLEGTVGFNKPTATPNNANVYVYSAIADSTGKFNLSCPGTTTTTTTAAITSTTTTTIAISTTTTTTTIAATTTTTTTEPIIPVTTTTTTTKSI